jgi:amino acid transporter
VNDPAPSSALKRDLTSRELFSLAFGSIVGVSWIILVGQWIADAGSLGAMLAFLIGGALILPIGHIYAELGQKLPATGGELVYAYRFFGNKAAFGIAWVLALFYTAVCGFEAVSAAWLVSAIVPGVKGPELYQFAGTPLHLGDLVLGVAFALSLLWLQLRGAQLTAQVQDLMVLAMLVLAGLFLFAAFGGGEIGNMQPLIGSEYGKMLALLLATPLFYAGFGAVPQALGESSEEARRRLPIIIFIVLIASILFHVGVILGTALVLTPAEALGTEFPVADAFARAFGSQSAARAALFVGVLGLLTTWNACFFSGSRVLFALGNGGLGPSWLGRTEQKRGVPRLAILIVFFFTVLAVPFGRELLIPIITLGGIAVTLMFSMVSFCLLKLRQTQSRSLALPLIGCIISVSLLLLNVYQLVGIAVGGRFVEVVVLILWAGSGILLWMGGRQARSRMSAETREERICGSATNP